MNNKGFMMAEVVVVASIVLVTLVGLYSSYSKIFSIYNQRIDYYDVPTLYELANIRENVSNYGDYSSMEAIVDETYEKVYYLRYTDLERLSESSQISSTFKDYLIYLEGSITIDTVYMLVMERCINNDIDNCKYAYLEVFN